MNYTAIIVGCVLVVIGAVIVQAILRARSAAMRNHPELDDPLTDFRQMRDQGAISETEYQRLKRVIARQPVKEDRRETGL